MRGFICLRVCPLHPVPRRSPPRPVSRYWVLFAVAYLDLGVACGRATLTLSFSVLSLSLASCPLPTFPNIPPLCHPPLGCHANNRLQPPLILVAFSFFYGAPTWYPGTPDGKFLKSSRCISHIHSEKKPIESIYEGEAKPSVYHIQKGQ